jgi:predicted dehydrogenase
VSVLVLGTGEMGAEYVRALLAHGVSRDDLLVVGRDAARAAAFGAEHGVDARGGGVAALSGAWSGGPAIVAVGHRELPGAAEALLGRGCKAILLEKPGALFRSRLEGLRSRVDAAGAQVFVAFNRRFYPSVAALRGYAEADGGLLSCSFDFTELAARVLPAGAAKGYPPEAYERWAVVNSMHVIDLFVHLAGKPSEWEQRRAGALPWHRAGATFAGSGITGHGVLFSYLATWGGAGRWSVEATTAQRKLVLRPLETLQMQDSGTFELRAVELPAEPAGTKPGLAAEVGAFLEAAAGGAVDPRLCDLDDAIRSHRVTERIAGYGGVE